MSEAAWILVGQEGAEGKPTEAQTPDIDLEGGTS